MFLNTSLTRQTTDTPGFKPFTTAQFQSCKLAYIKIKIIRIFCLSFLSDVMLVQCSWHTCLNGLCFLCVFFILLQGFDPGEDTYQVCGLQFLYFEAMKLNN